MKTEDLELVRADRDGVGLAFVDIGPRHASRPIVFVHGWCGDHTLFAPQIASFSTDHRVVAVDLRGHGASDAPREEYRLSRFVEDLRWLCDVRAIDKPVLVGHSMGGLVALEALACAPGWAAGAIMIDSVVFPPTELRTATAELDVALRGPELPAVLAQVCEMLCPVADDRAVHAHVLASMGATPPHVVLSSFTHHLVDWDATAAIEACRDPVAYIGSENPMADLDRLKTFCPHVMIARTLGAGHFSPLLVPDQINAMVRAFLRRLPL